MEQSQWNNREATQDVEHISEQIRSLVLQGDVSKIVELQGRPYSIEGIVIHGQALGRTLGFPTINLGNVAEEAALPRPGVYLGVVSIYEDEGTAEQYNAIISAGYRPVVQGEEYLIEAYLIDFSKDVYDRKVSIDFLKYIREELHFDGLEQLVEQMKKDELIARRFFDQQ